MKTWKIITIVITALMICMYMIGFAYDTSASYDNNFKIVFITVFINIVLLLAGFLIKES